jgi:hypothetical protein
MPDNEEKLKTLKDIVRHLNFIPVFKEDIKDADAGGLDYKLIPIGGEWDEKQTIYVDDLKDAAREWIKELEKINYCPKCGKYSKEYCSDEYAHFCSNEGCNDNVWYGDGEIEKIEWIKIFFNLNEDE